MVCEIIHDCNSCLSGGQMGLAMYSTMNNDSQYTSCCVWLLLSTFLTIESRLPSNELTKNAHCTYYGMVGKL